MADRAPKRISIATRDPDEAHEYLRETYVDHAVHLTGDQERFRFRHHITDSGPFFVAHYEHSMDCRVDTDPFGYLLIGHVLDGHLMMSTGREEISPEPGELFLLDPAVPMHIHWEGLRAGLVRLDLDVVNRVAADASGDSSAGVRFGLTKVITQDRVRRWHGLVRYLTHEFLANDAAYSSPLIYAQTVRLLAATVLETFPSSVMRADPVRPGGADAGAVRRAVAYIEEHARRADRRHRHRRGRAARDADVAGRVPASPRHDSHDVPAAGADRRRASRLAGGRSDGGATVADIARRWGFAHHGRFAAAYAQRHGRSPRRTLYG